MRAAKAQTSLRIRGKSATPDISEIALHTSVDVCTPTLLHPKISLHTAHAVLSAPLFLEQNIKHFVWPDLGPNCPLKLVCHSLWGGAGSSTANSISAADKRTG